MTTRQPAQSEQYNEDEDEEDGSGEQTTLQDVNTGANVNNKIALEE